MGKRLDITGQKFGRLTALRYSHTDAKSKKAVWECACDCGNTHYVTAKDLRSGNTKSCGCTKVERAKMLKYKDGRRSERLYGVWNTMMKRCYCTTSNTYRFYGAKGVKVCDEWHDYANFRNWAYENGYDENAPRGQCTIDRIDFTSNYSPDNCRWVSMDVQRKNKSHGDNPFRDPITGKYKKKVSV